tara:strand:+ start:286 stop:576 length:291 start_codon:yes stop_codon:yes gene_type:complete
MSPNKKNKLNKLRKNLDNIDKQLIEIIKKRTKVIDNVIKIKEFKNQIVDKKRINVILKKIKKLSIKNKVDPKVTNRIWKNMIWSYIDYERRNFKKK